MRLKNGTVSFTPFFAFDTFHTDSYKDSTLLWGKEVRDNPKHKVKTHVMPKKLTLAQITFRM